MPRRTRAQLVGEPARRRLGERHERAHRRRADDEPPRVDQRRPPRDLARRSREAGPFASRDVTAIASSRNVRALGVAEAVRAPTSAVRVVRDPPRRRRASSEHDEVARAVRVVGVRDGPRLALHEELFADGGPDERLAERLDPRGAGGDRGASDARSWASGAAAVKPAASSHAKIVASWRDGDQWTRFGVRSSTSATSPSTKLKRNVTPQRCPPASGALRARASRARRAPSDPSCRFRPSPTECERRAPGAPSPRSREPRALRRQSEGCDRASTTPSRRTRSRRRRTRGGQARLYASASCARSSRRRGAIAACRDAPRRLRAACTRSALPSGRVSRAPTRRGSPSAPSARTRARANRARQDRSTARPAHAPPHRAPSTRRRRSSRTARRWRR